ncbi:sulfatase-like hydrolase/transferase [Sporosarcina koreensis]|uniref:sulfatase-like hydrolase/transferase n=1 Tax=Sporosarcina koreensis TaxID=334735 RepID=UPI00075E2CCC|nr:sulfatase-like hydrolase/transferase [Sporosarcina koreensis]
MGLIGEKNEYFKQISKAIEEAFFVGDIQRVGELINKCGNGIDNATICSQKAIYALQIGDTTKALKILEEGIIKHPFNSDIHYNLSYILNEIERFEDSIHHGILAIKYAIDKEKNLETVELVENILKSVRRKNGKILASVINKYKIEKCLLNERDYRIYPLNTQEKDQMRTIFKENEGNQYLFNMYQSMGVTSVDANSRFFFKSELIKGKENNHELQLVLDYPSVIPISLMEPQTKIKFYLNSKEYIFENTYLIHNKIHYIRISEPGNLVIQSDKNIFVGKPIQETMNNPSKRLVLQIFIDGLSMKFLEERGMREVVPNIYNFFEKGFISTNCYATSEWTMPSKATVNTGKYPSTHKLLHPALNYYSFEKYHKLIPEYFSEAGYLTAKISSNWRTNPAFGYYKGFDRILYQNFMGGMDVRDTIMETIEHIESFKHKSNFISISIMDVHNATDEIEQHLLAETKTDLSYRVKTNNKGVTSVHTMYDESKIYKYNLEIKRVDFFLGILFDYINKNYVEDDVVVLLHSDHGQTYIEDKDEILHSGRTKIPLMIKGKYVPNTHSNEIIELVDLLPILLKVSDLKLTDQIDGELPKIFGGNKEKEYALTQLLHPNQTYKARIEDETYVFRFETKEKVQFDLTFEVDEYEVSLINKETGEETSSTQSDIVDKYEEVIFQHIKDFIKWK